MLDYLFKFKFEHKKRESLLEIIFLEIQANLNNLSMFNLFT